MVKAAGRGDKAAVTRLLADGASLTARGEKDITPLQWMVLRQKLKGFAILLDAGADPLQPGIDGDTAAHLAAAVKNPAYLSLLLARGLSPDVPNANTGKTPLMSAMMGERDKQFEMLMKAGADPGLADAMGNAPLHVAAQINEPVRVLTLLKAGAPPEARNAQGETFQRYLQMGDPALLNRDTLAARQAVSEWLIQHKVPIEPRLPGR